MARKSQIVANESVQTIRISDGQEKFRLIQNYIFRSANRIYTLPNEKLETPF